MNDDITRRVRAIQEAMTDAAHSSFLGPELDALRIVVRLTVEFHDYLQHDGAEVASHQHDVKRDPRYVSESVFSGIRAFCSVTAAYHVLVGATQSGVEWNTLSMSSLREDFLSRFHRFELERRFEEKCRLLVDLFKLQIVFAGVLYD